MPQGEDDPRQVLSILNSLGFIGVTAEQLKSFMKDLKLHRKMKERQREQWREETKRKIFLKQRQALAELIEQNTSENSHRDCIDDSPVVKIKINCVTESDTNDDIENDEEYARILHTGKSESSHKKQSKKKGIDSSPQRRDKPVGVIEQPRKQVSNQTDIVRVVPDRVASAPELSGNTSRSRPRSKSTTSNRSSSRNPPSSRSQSKSFIRPWKLHPHVQRLPQNVRSDPVLLYQQYQKEWKQRSLPGENRHAEIRWAVREKMLGTDPTPRPILKQSSSSVSVKKR